jgi:SAM-dependent methyltransferase
MSLENTGERQVAPALDGIRRDHVARYEFAAKKIPQGSRVIDYACGIGYGCRILADVGHRAVGYDVDREAIEYGLEHYRLDDGRVTLMRDNANAPVIPGNFDAAISFETIEHLQDPRPLLLALRESAPLLIASVPNEDVMPYEYAPGQTYAFHYRHYTKAQFNALLQECGWCAVEWYGQEGPESEVEPNNQGRTLIAVCMRDELPQQSDAEEKHIAILGLGPSIDQYLEITKRLGGRSRVFDQVWAINALGNVFDCDLIFHMDDIRIQEIRAKSAPASNIAAMVNWLKTSQVPVITSRAHPDYPALNEFPLEAALNALGHDYFNSTAAYAVAYAILCGATKISLFGMDYTYPNAHDAEKGRACVEFWLGQAHARGIEISLPKTTTLMDAMVGRAGRLYGYDTVDIAFNSQADGSVKLQFTEKTELPTAEQIEKNYDHSAPIEQQHLRIS